MITNRFKFRAITTQEIKNICNSMKNKTDYNNVTIKMILDNWNISGTKIPNIINMAMRIRVFPNNRKLSMISPVENILKTNKCDEFLPINTLKTCKKIMEN